MKFGTRLAIVMIGAITGAAFTAQAQVSMWGSGYNMGMQPCPYVVKKGKGTDDKDDEVSSLKASIKEAKANVKKARDKERRLEKNLAADKTALGKYFQTNIYTVIEEHVTQYRQCTDYADTVTVDPKTGAPSSADSSSGKPSYAPFTQVDWMKSVCTLNTPGSINSNVCVNNFKKQGSSMSDSECARNINNFDKDRADQAATQSDLSDAQGKLDEYTRELADAKDRAKEDKDSSDDDDSKSKTEAGFCFQCAVGDTNWLRVGLDAALGIGSYYADRSNQRMVAQYNSNLGYPTIATQSSLAPWLFGLDAVSAIGSGTGQGAYGCSAMSGAMGGNGLIAGNGGAFGYPGSYFGAPYGGGMFNPMTGTWGTAGPWGLQGNPMLYGPNGGGYGPGYGASPLLGLNNGLGGGYYGNPGYPGGMSPLLGMGGNGLSPLGYNPFMGGAGGFAPGVSTLGNGYFGGNGYGSGGPYGFGYGGANFAGENSAALQTTQAGLNAEMANLANRISTFQGSMATGSAYGGAGGYYNMYGGGYSTPSYFPSYNGANYLGASGISGGININAGLPSLFTTTTPSSTSPSGIPVQSR